MLLTDLLQHFPLLHARGPIAGVRVTRLESFPAQAADFRAAAGSLYLHPDAQRLAAQLQAARLESRQSDVPVPLPITLLTPQPAQELTLPVKVWLTHPEATFPPLLSAELLRVLLSTPAQHQEREEQLSELMTEYLQAGRHAPADVLERAAQLGADLRRSRAVLLFSTASVPAWRAEPAASREQLLRVARRAVQGHEASVVLVRVGMELAVLIDPQRWATQDVAELLAKELTVAFPQQVLPIGVGRAVAAFTELRRSYHEARTALDLAATLPRAHRVIQYEAVRHLLIYREIRQNAGLKQLIQESLAPLAELPSGYQRTMLETLAAYLEHGRSPTRAATALGVHPNTMKYRMKRIGELIDIEQLSGQQYALYYLAAHLLLQDAERSPQ